MIKEFEKQILLTEKTNALLDELKEYTAEVKQANAENLQTLKRRVETDMQEIVDYCKRMEIPKNKTEWVKPSEGILLKEEKDHSIRFEITYDTEKDRYE